jgi:hypothetical protein
LLAGKILGSYADSNAHSDENWGVSYLTVMDGITLFFVAAGIFRFFGSSGLNKTAITTPEQSAIDGTNLNTCVI